MIVFDHTWSSVSSTGGQDPFLINNAEANSWRCFVRPSTGTATTVTIQMAESTGGPWARVGSDTVSTAAPVAFDFVGPMFGYVRAYSGSTGATIRLVGVD